MTPEEIEALVRPPSPSGSVPGCVTYVRKTKPRKPTEEECRLLAQRAQVYPRILGFRDKLSGD